MQDRRLINTLSRSAGTHCASCCMFVVFCRKAEMEAVRKREEEEQKRLAEIEKKFEASLFSIATGIYWGKRIESVSDGWCVYRPYLGCSGSTLYVEFVF